MVERHISQHSLTIDKLGLLPNDKIEATTNLEDHA